MTSTIYISFQKLLLKDAKFEYYKVPIAPGTKMHHGAAARTCQSEGLEHVCLGPSSCRVHYRGRKVVANYPGCVATPVSAQCSLSSGVW